MARLPPALGVLLGALAWGGLAHAAKERVAVLDLVIEGDAPPELRERLDASLASGLREAGYDVVGRATVQVLLRDAPELLGCVTTMCLQRVAKKVDARHFVRARVEATGAAYSFVLELWGIEASDGPLQRVERSCPVCTLGEAHAALTKAAAELPGARSPVPAAPLPEIPTVVPPPAVTAPILPPTPQEPAVSPTPWRTLKWVGVGTSAVLIGGGVIWAALDGKGVDCEAMAKECPREIDGTGGFVMLGVGLAAAGVTTYLFLQDRRAVSVSAGAGGASVVLAGWF